MNKEIQVGYVEDPTKVGGNRRDKGYPIWFNRETRNFFFISPTLKLKVFYYPTFDKTYQAARHHLTNAPKWKPHIFIEFHQRRPGHMRLGTGILGSSMEIKVWRAEVLSMVADKESWMRETRIVYRPMQIDFLANVEKLKKSKKSDTKAKVATLERDREAGNDITYHYAHGVIALPYDVRIWDNLRKALDAELHFVEQLDRILTNKSARFVAKQLKEGKFLNGAGA